MLQDMDHVIRRKSTVKKQKPAPVQKKIYELKMNFWLVSTDIMEVSVR